MLTSVVLAAFISWRYLLRSKSSKAGLIVSIVAMTLSCSGFIIVSSVMNGIHENITKQFMNLEGRATIYGGNLDPKTALSIEQVRGVDKAIMTLDREGIIFLGGRAKGVVVRGMSQLPPYIRESAPKNNFVLVGSELAMKINNKIGEDVSVNMVLDGSIRKKTLKFAGAFKSPFRVYDSNFLFMDLDGMREEFNLGETHKIDKIQVYGTDSAVNKIKENLKKSDLFVEKWIDRNSSMAASIKFEKWGMNIVLTCVLIIASFSIVSGTLLLFRERRKDVALISILGGGRTLVFSIFSIAGVTIGVVGGIIGVVLGVSAAAALPHSIQLMEDLLSVQILDWPSQNMDKLPVDIRLEEVVIIFAITTLISFCAALYTSVSAFLSPHHKFLGVK